jgi:SdrD B-like domain
MYNPFSALIAVLAMIVLMSAALLRSAPAPEAELVYVVAQQTQDTVGTATAADPDTSSAAQPDGVNTPTRTPTPINVGNFVWDDLDQDGRQDAGEPGIAGVTVQLWNDAKNNLIDSTQTNSNGNYTLVAPTPGNYRVRVVLPSILDTFSPRDLAGGDDTDDSDIYPSGSNLGFTDIYVFASNLISITSIDAGIIVYRPPTPTRTPTPINIGNFVWNDLDADGVQDPGEPGVPYVTVQLWNAARTQLISQATTNINGNYTLVAPVPGDYRVRVILPSGASFSLKDQGVDDLKDSDINALLLSSTYGFTDAFTIASNVISTTIYDAGMRNVPPPPTVTPNPSGSGSTLYLPLIVQ